MPFGRVREARTGGKRAARPPSSFLHVISTDSLLLSARKPHRTRGTRLTSPHGPCRHSNTATGAVPPPCTGLATHLMWSGFNSQSVHENKLQENRFITISPSYQENTEGRDRSRGIAHDYLLPTTASTLTWQHPALSAGSTIQHTNCNCGTDAWVT